MNYKKYKYAYWHEITAISEEYQKYNPDMKVGLLMSRQNKHPYSVDIVDIKTLKKYPSAYTLKYIGRLPSDASTEEVCQMYKNFEEKTKANTEGAKR